MEVLFILFMVFVILVGGPILVYCCVKFGRQAWINCNKNIEKKKTN